MKSKRVPNLSSGPTPERFQRSPLRRDVFTPGSGPPVARHRAKPVLTPYEVRQDIIEEAASLPDSTRVRSLRRRLTALDRLLGDNEAEALDRLLTCIDRLSNVRSVIQPGVQIRVASYGRVPFDESQQRELAAMAFVTKQLSPVAKALVSRLASGLEAHGGKLDSGKDRDLLAQLKELASNVSVLYGKSGLPCRPQVRSDTR